MLVICVTWMLISGRSRGWRLGIPKPEPQIWRQSGGRSQFRGRRHPASTERSAGLAVLAASDPPESLSHRGSGRTPRARMDGSHVPSLLGSWQAEGMEQWSRRMDALQGLMGSSGEGGLVQGDRGQVCLPWQPCGLSLGQSLVWPFLDPRHGGSPLEVLEKPCGKESCPLLRPCAMCHTRVCAKSHPHWDPLPRQNPPRGEPYSKDFLKGQTQKI